MLLYPFAHSGGNVRSGGLYLSPRKDPLYVRGALTGEVNLSVPVAQAGMYDDTCIIYAEQIVAAA